MTTTGLRASISGCVVGITMWMRSRFRRSLSHCTGGSQAAAEVLNFQCFSYTIFVMRLLINVSVMLNPARMRFVLGCRWRAAPGLWHRQRRATDSNRIGFSLKRSRRVAGMRLANPATPHDGKGPASFYRRVCRRYFNATYVQRFVSLATGRVSIDRRRMRSCSVRPGL